MRKNLNFKVISALVIAALGWQSVANAVDTKVSSNTVDSNKVFELKNGVKAREMINNEQRSLYQIALISGISVSELREMNAGRFDKKDVVEVGELLVLPENSQVLPALTTNSNKIDKYENLPSLGSDDNYDPKQNKDALATQIASTLQTLASQDWKSITSAENGGLSGHLRNKGKQYAEDYIRNGVKNQVVDPVRNTVQDFLGRFGKAQLQFNLSDKGSFDNVNLKLFSPWYDTDSTLIFTQLSFQEYEHNRRIGNFGIGQRWDVADNKWLLGYNVFLDHDFQRSHNRLGIGAEAWSDYMKLAVNYYHPLSDWKDSKDFDDYLERAAKGYDVRFQGYLPQYPHLGGSLMYEKYFGDKVALFGKDNLQKNPSALTFGVDYTPVPLFTIKAEHKHGQDSKKATNAQLTLDYRIGVPLKDQLDPDMVQLARSLKGSRYDLVDRNNYIVLEYKDKKMTVDLGLEAVQLIEGHSYGVTIGAHNVKGLSKLTWSGDMLDIDAGGGFLCSNVGICTTSTWANPPAELDNWKITAPNYLDDNGDRHPVRTNGKYSLSVTVTDSRGKTATSNSVSFEVLPNPELRKVGVWAIDQTGNPTSLINQDADGHNSVTLLASLVKPKSGATRSWSLADDFDGFSDALLMQKIGKTFQSSVLNLWTATSNGKKVNLIDGTSGNVNSCPSKEPCIIVKSFEQVKKGGKLSDKASTAAGAEALGDTYTIDVASNFVGVVDFTVALDQYGTSFNKASVDFAGGQAGLIKVYRSDGVLVASTVGNTLQFEPSGPNEWKVGNEYYVKAYSVDGTTEITDPFVVWSLVDDNSSACPGNATTAALPNAIDNPTGPWFNVGMGINAHYTIRSLNMNSYASSGTSISAVNGAPSYIDWTPINTSLPACAGDQGFKLQVSVN